MKDVLTSKDSFLFFVLAAFFITNTLIAEFISVKIFAFEPTLGFSPLNWNLFGQSGSLNLTVGVLLWPIVFVMTDIINEYFGKRGVRMLSFVTAGMILYGFGMIFFAIRTVPATWWLTSYTEQGVPDAQKAFEIIFGQGMWLIAGSLTAFLLGQLIDVMVFQAIRRATGERSIWLRATGSTLVSQFVDSFVVLYIAFVLGAGWEVSLFLAVGTVNYIYKFCIAILMTPVIYAMHSIIDRFLGEPLATALKRTAAVG